MSHNAPAPRKPRDKMSMMAPHIAFTVSEKEKARASAGPRYQLQERMRSCVGGLSPPSTSASCCALVWGGKMGRGQAG